MEHPLAFNNSFDLVNSWLQPAPQPTPLGARPWRAVTISRQTGCGAAIIARELVTCLHRYATAWKVFDRNLMAKILEDHDLPARIARFLPEDRLTALQDIVDDIFSFRPDSQTVLRQTCETILRLTEMGNVILIGRGANVITTKLPGVFHVRLVAPLADRVNHAHEFYGLTRHEARAFCLREDLGRKRFLKKYFDADIDDPLLYHLTINTSLMTFGEAAQTIARAMMEQSGSASRVSLLPSYTSRAHA